MTLRWAAAALLLMFPTSSNIQDRLKHHVYVCAHAQR